MKKETEIEVKPDIKVIGEPNYSLQPGYAFKYKGKEWNPEMAPDEAIRTSKAIEKQVIHDCECIVFKDSDGTKWAQAVQTCKGTMKKAKEPKKSCASEPKRKAGKPKKVSEPKRKAGRPRKTSEPARRQNKINQKDYKYYVVLNNKIIAGNEYKEDAKEFIEGNAPDKYMKQCKVHSKRALLTMGIDPDVNDNWGNFPNTYPNKSAEPKRKPGRPRKISEPGPLPPMKLNGCPPKGSEPLGCDVGRQKKTPRAEEPREVSIKTKKGIKTFIADKEKAAQRKKEKRAMRYNPIREAIEKDYKISRGGMIKSPGKFEGEMIYMPYFYGVFLEGGADGEDENGRIKVLVDNQDRLIFPELGKTRKHVIFTVDDSGFVNELFRRG
jgi:hypothetical protein